MQKINVDTSALKETAQELKEEFQKINQQFQQEQNLKKETEDLKQELLKAVIRAESSNRLNATLVLNAIYEKVKLNLEKQNLEKK